MSQFRAPQQEL